jgi:hypothetical protein
VDGLSTLNLVAACSTALDYVTFESNLRIFFKKGNDIYNTERTAMYNGPDKLCVSRTTCCPWRHFK